MDNLPSDEISACERILSNRYPINWLPEP